MLTPDREKSTENAFLVNSYNRKNLIIVQVMKEFAINTTCSAYFL